MPARWCFLASSLGSGIIIDNASLVFSNGTTILTNGISGSGTLTQNGTGSLELNASTSYAGGTTIQNGTIQSDNPNSVGSRRHCHAGRRRKSANNATFQAQLPGTATFTNANAITVAAGGSGPFMRSRRPVLLDYNLSGNLTLNNALTLRNKPRTARFSCEEPSSAAAQIRPLLTIDGGGSDDKIWSGLYGSSSSTFTGGIIITNNGNLQSLGSSMN